jgi:insecticidal toxin complex protein TccC
MLMSASLHQHTPSLTVTDSRGLSVRTIAYHRADVGVDIVARPHRQVFDANGHLNEQWDPRLLELSKVEVGVQANQTALYSLSGQVLQTESVDAGWRVACYDSAELIRDSWDGRDTHRRYHYDELMRPVKVFEQASRDAPEQCVERFTYAGSSEEGARSNRCGQLIRHDDTAGCLWREAFGLPGQPLVETRQFCASLTAPNWPESEVDLEVRAYTTHWRHDALGTVVEQTDAVGHVQRFEVDVAGQPCASYLDGIALLKSTTYTAFGQVEVEQAGNDVVTTAHYSPVDGRLCSLKARKLGGKALQDLHYQYDSVGNIERIEDLSQPVQWFARQRIQAVSIYTYDTLYQLTRATGRENASQTMGPDLPGLEIFGTKDDSRWRNYTQIYTYDRGANLIQLKHDAGAGNTYTREMVVDERSNRSLLKDSSPIDFTQGFDASGNRLGLTAGQVMQWNTHNQLQKVTQVLRDEEDGQDDDVETYVYDGGGIRVRKVRRAKTRGGEHISEVRYLPGLEIRTRTSGEHLQLVIAQAGRNGVRLLHWESGRRKGIDNDQLRYSLSDQLGSSTLELDQHAELLSQESYYPYGGTAWWAAKSAVEAKYKTVRYSGKERDATGLYYYGLRYYAPWLQRWINPDPAGDVDGLNLYCMVRNNPVTLSDPDGLAPGHDNQLRIHMFYHGEIPEDVSSNIINTIESSPNNIVNLWFDDRARDTFPNLSGEFPNLEIMDAGKLKYIKPRGNEASFANIETIFSEIEEADNKGKEKSLSDLAELLATYQYGGLYLDADVVILKEFSKSELFGDSEFRTHISLNNSKASVDYYDALGFKNAFDGDLEEILKELSSDYEEGYLVGTSEPGQMVRIINIVRLKLKNLLTEDEIDDTVSEGVIPEDNLRNITEALRSIDISATLKKKIQFMPMKHA